MLACRPEEALENLFDLVERVQERKTMRSYGVTPDEITWYADNVIETQQRLLVNNYVPLTRDDILRIYEDAL